MVSGGQSCGQNSCRDVCMESTGKCWIPVFNLLEDELNVTIANSKWVKAVKGNKDVTLFLSDKSSGITHDTAAFTCVTVNPLLCRGRADL